MISKQYLITGIIWAIIGALFSVFFRLQLGFPDDTFPVMETFLGEWAKGGKLSPEFYYALHPASRPGFHPPCSLEHNQGRYGQAPLWPLPQT